VGTKGTIPWLTNKLKLLGKIEPEKEKHYDRLREHFESMGLAAMMALFRSPSSLFALKQPY
jgi:hypothetical protein